MKKISAVLLIIFCVLTLSSCVSVGYEKAPAWLKGKTWTGIETFIVEEGSNSVNCSYSFNDDGEFDFVDYLGYVPEDKIITTSGNSKTYKITMVSTAVYEGITYNSEDVLTFTKISNNECEFNSIFKTTKSDGQEDIITSSGTLYAN